MPAASSPSTRSLAALFVLIAAAGAAGQRWTLRKPAVSPPALFGHAMAYDAARKQVILFGGYVNGPPFLVNDTWAWDGKTWTKLFPASRPAARTDHAMAYDSGRRRIVLYGGGTGLFGFSDTWEWDGKTWTQLFPASRPALTTGEMAYDAARRRTVFFATSGPSFPPTTWEWDGKTWKLRFPKTRPPTRGYHAMAYDAARQRVVMFGGYLNKVYPNGTWEWDGINWVKRKPLVTPPGRALHSIVYDPMRRCSVLFGGWNSGKPFNDTWEWDGRTWTRRMLSLAPEARGDHAAAYDAARRRIVLFGGRSFTGMRNDTWEYEAEQLSASGSARPGSTVTLTLSAPGNEGRPYQVGTSFGTGPLRIDTRWIDLSPDTLLVVSTAGYWPGVFSGYRGLIDAKGSATAWIRIPNVPALIGTRTHTAFVTLDPKAPSGIRSISNTVAVTVAR